MRYYYDLPEGVPLGDPQHQLMAQHYRDIIKQVLREVDDSQIEEVYDALAWVGLMGNGAINPATGLPVHPTIVWSNLTEEQRLNIIATITNFNNNTPNCK